MDTDLSFDDSEFQTQIVPLADMPALIEASRKPCSNGNPCGTLQHHIPCSAKVHLVTKVARLNLTNEWVRIEAGDRIIGDTTRTVVKVDYRADQHAYRMKWLGLLRKLVHRSALWQIRPEAIEFLRGELSIPAKVLVNHGNVYYASEEQMFVGECGNKLDRAYWDNYRMTAYDPID
jgi:hypothetical protein